jgi:hypothetical protein
MELTVVPFNEGLHTNTHYYEGVWKCPCGYEENIGKLEPEAE